MDTTVLITPTLAEAANLWRNGVLYFDGKNYRWSGSASLPNGVKRRSIVSCNRELKSAFLDVAHLHGWAITKRGSGFLSDFMAQQNGFMTRRTAVAA